MLQQRDLTFKSLIAAIVVLKLAVDCIAEEEITGLVTRRSTGDVYRNYNAGDSFGVCNVENNFTYVFDERQCVDQQQLLNGCIFSIAPNEEFSSPTIILTITDPQSTNLQMTAETFNSRSRKTNAVIIYNRGTNQPVNGSLCVISNLEVYRGRDQVNEIESRGFSLSESGVIEIDNASLAYSFEEYLGEIYRMNLSCSDGGLPDSGCLFFKVLGRTNVTSAKFNDLVPGTVYGREGDALTTTISTSTTSTESNIDTTVNTNQQPTLLPTTLQMSSPNTTSAPSRVDNRTLMYAIYAIAAVGVVALLVVVILLCAVIAFLLCPSSKNKRKRESVNLTTLKDLPSETSDLTATAPVNIPITQRDLPPPPDPKWDTNPAYNLSTSWNEGSNV